ncbi:helix-turn-helix transcriptional regulator [Rhodococcus sp. SJ-2]
MSEPKIYVEIDGTPVSIDECTWVQTAPCGCESGWMVARYYPTYEQALDGFWDSKKQRAQKEKLGFKVKIVRHKDINIKDDCTHTPKWGVEPIVTPSAEDRFGRRVRLEREARGWTQADLAKRIEVAGVSLHPSAIAKIELRDVEKPRAIRLDEAQAIADAFGLFVDEMWETEDHRIRWLDNLIPILEEGRELIECVYCERAAKKVVRP